jgi:hypothetical protein
MAATQKLIWGDWSDLNVVKAPARYISVADEVVRSVAVLPPKMTVAEALADYALGYDAGPDRGETIRVKWELTENGRTAGEGVWKFVAGGEVA